MRKIDVFSLLTKPLWQLSGEEYVALHSFAAKTAAAEGEITKTITRCTGVRELAQFLDCCESTVYAMKREGVLDEAIISRIGKKIVFDGEVARRCANEYQKRQRAQRSDER